MNLTKKTIGKCFFYALSVCLLVYILYSIGLQNIYNTWLSTNFYMVGIAVTITIFATAIRIYKFYLLLHWKEWSNIIEIFATSRIGKEVSFAGYFLPLLKKDHRSVSTLQNLVVDRYAEILATLLLAFLSSCFIINNGSFETLIFFVLVTALILFILLPFINIPFYNFLIRYKGVSRIVEMVGILQTKIKLFRSFNILAVYGLSLVVTALDFLSSYYVFKAYNVEISLFYISTIWASSAFISMLAFMIIGSTEISIIYLFHELTSVGKAVIGSTIIVARLINLVVLALLMLPVVFIGKRLATSPKSIEAEQ